MYTFWVFSHIDNDCVKHYRQFQSPIGPYYHSARQEVGPGHPCLKSKITGKLFRTQEHDDLTISHILVREIEGVDFQGLTEKRVAKFITALTNYAGTEKTMTFRSRYAFNKFIKEHA
jgi:hypothetical protein